MYQAPSTGMRHMSHRFSFFGHNSLGKRDLPTIYYKIVLFDWVSLHSPGEPRSFRVFIVWMEHARWNSRAVSWSRHVIGRSTWRNWRPLQSSNYIFKLCFMSLHCTKREQFQSTTNIPTQPNPWVCMQEIFSTYKPRVLLMRSTGRRKLNKLRNTLRLAI